MDLYRCEANTAAEILNARLSLENEAEMRGMVDAVLVEQAVEEGKIVLTPAWLPQNNMIRYRKRAIE